MSLHSLAIPGRKENLQDLVKYECYFYGKKGDPMLPWKFWFTSSPSTASLGVILGKSQGACPCPQWGWSCPLHCSPACIQALLRVWFHKEPNLNAARLVSVSMSCHSCMLPQRMRLGQCQLGESALVLLQTIHSILNVSLLWSSCCKIINFTFPRTKCFSLKKCIGRLWCR